MTTEENTIPVVLDPGQAAPQDPVVTAAVDPVPVAIDDPAPTTADEALHAAYEAEIVMLKGQCERHDADMTAIRSELAAAEEAALTARRDHEAAEDALARVQRDAADAAPVSQRSPDRHLAGTPAGRERLAKLNAHEKSCAICRTNGRPCIEVFKLAGYVPEMYVEMFGEHPPTRVKE